MGECIPCSKGISACRRNHAILFAPTLPFWCSSFQTAPGRLPGSQDGSHTRTTRGRPGCCACLPCVLCNVWCVCVRTTIHLEGTDAQEGHPCARGPPLPPSASAWRSLGRLVGNVLGVCHIAVLGTWARRQVDAVTARRIFQSDTALSSSRSKAGR